MLWGLGFGVQGLGHSLQVLGPTRLARLTSRVGWMRKLQSTFEFSDEALNQPRSAREPLRGHSEFTIKGPPLSVSEQLWLLQDLPDH